MVMNAIKGDSAEPLKSTAKRSLSLHCLMMIRNEADIVQATTNHALELFDKIVIVDVQSADGTREFLDSVARFNPQVTLLTCKTQERYQSAMMNLLARDAFSSGADWVFFIDGDEFLNIEGREQLQSQLATFNGDVMHMPWINLVPSEYGSFDLFEINQTYFWSGRVSRYRKIAISSIYAHSNPHFHVMEGNHNVQEAPGGISSAENLGLSLLHIPVRSAERLRFKMAKAVNLLTTKHNAQIGEGDHTIDILSLLSSGAASDQYLNRLASDYGTHDNMVPIEPASLDWPRRKLPTFITNLTKLTTTPLSLPETISRESILKWKRPGFVKGSVVTAQIQADEIIISAAPYRGSGELISGKFSALQNVNLSIPEVIDLKLLMEMANASFTRIDVLRFSAWSKLIPLLYALFTLARPRRYVELGVHNGMSFFAACQISEQQAIGTECIAVDSWVGDPHASFHSSEIFDTFRETIQSQYPEQAYIQGMFLDARECFEDSSIDLLHIDGYHTYEAVKEDFETWLPKMSSDGIVIFHDINVHERGFGVWRFWEELKLKYPGFGFMHSHGLGVLYVGNQTNAVSKAFKILDESIEVRIFVQQYFETIGELAIEHRELTEMKETFASSDTSKDSKIREFQGYLEHRDATIASLEAMIAASNNGSEAASSSIDEVHRLQLAEQRDALFDRLDKARQTPVRDHISAEDPRLESAKNRLEVPKRGGLFGRLQTRRAVKRRDSELLAQVEAVINSGMFDDAFYLERYPDVRGSGLEPAWHYIRYGAFELRDPSDQFSSAAYFANNIDVLEAGLNPLYHYVVNGKNEGREW